MSTANTHSFTWSLALHLSCGVAMLWFVAQPLHELAPVHSTGNIIDLIPAPRDAQPTGPANELLPIVHMPELPKTAPQLAPDESEFAEPKPSASVTTQSTKAPTVVVPQKTERMTIAKFRKLHGSPPATAQKSVLSSVPKIRKINAADFDYSGSGPNTSSPTEHSTLPSELKDDFLSGLLAELQRSYADREAAFAGLSAEVEFTLDTNGRLKNAQLLTPSDSKEFDQAVMAALERVRLDNCPAEAIGRRIRARFRVPSS